MTENNSTDGTVRFICLNYVNSTAIALSALDARDFPLLKSDYMASFTRAFTDNTKNIYAPHDAILSSLYLIELHPERVGFDYDEVLEDKDGTKRQETMIKKAREVICKAVCLKELLTIKNASKKKEDIQPPKTINKFVFV